MAAGTDGTKAKNGGPANGAALCPICRRAPAQPGFKPFCSRRCADIDLGRWLGDGYAIPVAPEEDEDGGGSEPSAA